MSIVKTTPEMGGPTQTTHPIETENMDTSNKNTSQGGTHPTTDPKTNENMDINNKNAFIGTIGKKAYPTVNPKTDEALRRREFYLIHKSLCDDDKIVREIAYKALEKVQLNPFSSVDRGIALARWLINSDKYTVRHGAIILLGRLDPNNTEVLDYIERGLGENYKEIQNTAFQVACRLRDKEKLGVSKALEVTKEWLKSKNPRVRKIAIEIIACNFERNELSDDEAYKVLRAGLLDYDTEVKEAAIYEFMY